MREVTIAVVQFAPKLGEVEENLARMAQWVERICQEQETNLIIFPELSTTGYECGMRFTELAQRIPGHATSYLGERASQCNTHILFGMAEEGKPESVIYDTAVLIAPEGEVVAKYQKTHLKGEERLAFRPGYRYTVVETALGPLGMLIGWDIAFPEAARSLALQGAELLCVCANWEKPHQAEWRTYIYARAFENSAFVAAANRVGEEYTYAFLGDSLIVGPRGETYALLTGETAEGEAPHEKEGYAVATIDLDNVRKYRDDFQLLQARQPRAYRELVKMY